MGSIYKIRNKIGEAGYKNQEPGDKNKTTSGNLRRQLNTFKILIISTLNQSKRMSLSIKQQLNLAMKKAILIPILIMGLVYHVFAQQKGKTKHMTITIMETFSGRGHAPNMFITRDDTAQVEKYVEFNQKVKVKDAEAAHENQIMQLLEPYYHDGWKLATTSSAKILGDENVSRFFFIKDE